MIEVNYCKAVAVVSLDRGITNALNLEVVQALAETLEKMRTMPGVQAIILCFQ